MENSEPKNLRQVDCCAACKHYYDKAYDTLIQGFEVDYICRNIMIIILKHISYVISLRSRWHSMNHTNDLTIEQWQAIAEKLADCIDIMCGGIVFCDDCPFYGCKNCKPRFALEYVKKELGYETFRETKKERKPPFTCKDCYFNHYEPSLYKNLILRCIAAKLGRIEICERFKYEKSPRYGGEYE